MFENGKFGQFLKRKDQRLAFRVKYEISARYRLFAFRI